ncbi:hypothetical protein [Paenibacillus polymyxa]|uniref:hypothetical protein n=1 Tax=Paenibacillus polymyxa TaxID=1406 RepID=UPI001865EB88|nr:hypothetical protein [Paenibacillus polymyxa]MBE3650754.1 hypothetical protein [Paenibacillus polymyxa]
MEIKFEAWIKTQDISEEAQMLFDDAIKCYRIGVYRPAFLMSYLGFMKALRDRLLKSPKPHLINDNEWPKIINDLKNDKLWEEKVITCIEEKEKEKRTEDGEKIPPVSKVFLVSNEIIEDMPYWRRIRNTCAHAKDSIISHSNVEAFWLFLESHLAKFIVNGGKQALLDKIQNHFDIKKSKPSFNFTYLVDQIPLVVKHSEIPGLLVEIYENVVSLNYGKERMDHAFWRSIAYSTDSRILNGFIEFISSDNDVFSDFVEAFPDRLLLCTSKVELIRFFWMESLFSEIGNYDETFWELSDILIRNNIIPHDEVEPFVKKLVTKVRSGSPVPNEEQIKTLKKHCFFETMRDRLFQSSILNQSYRGYESANRNSQIIIFYLENNKLDLLVVKELNKLFQTYTFGRFYEEMETYIQDNKPFLTEFNRIAKENGIEVTSFFAIQDSEEIEK